MRARPPARVLHVKTAKSWMRLFRTVCPPPASALWRDIRTNCSSALRSVRTLTAAAEPDGGADDARRLQSAYYEHSSRRPTLGIDSSRAADLIGKNDEVFMRTPRASNARDVI